jgi:hypothetical protein
MSRPRAPEDARMTPRPGSGSSLPPSVSRLGALWRPDPQPACLSVPGRADRHGRMRALMRIHPVITAP